MLAAGRAEHVATAASVAVADDATRGPLDLLTLGEPLICLTSHGRLSASPTLVKSVGGAEANVAIGLARLGLRTGFISRVGADPFGEEIVRTLRGEGVDVSRVQRSPARPTGLMVVELRAPEDARVHYYRQGSAVTELAGIGRAPASRYVHLTGITLALGGAPADAARDLLSQARALGARVSFDPNIRLKLWSLEDAVTTVREILPHVDDLLLSEAEALAIAAAGDLDEAIAWLTGRGIARVVVRRGAAGAIGCADGERHEVAAQAPGAVVDCVGAGDAFTAGYLFERIRGASFGAALSCGSWAAGHAVSHHGHYEGLPDRADYATWRGVATEVDR